LGRAVGPRRLRPAGVREEASGSRARNAGIQGRQPPRHGARRARRMALDLLLLGPRFARSLPEGRLLGEPRGRRDLRAHRAPGSGPGPPRVARLPGGGVFERAVAPKDRMNFEFVNSSRFTTSSILRPPWISS